MSLKITPKDRKLLKSSKVRKYLRDVEEGLEPLTSEAIQAAMDSMIYGTGAIIVNREGFKRIDPREFFIEKTGRVQKPYPKRLQAGEIIFKIILDKFRKAAFSHNIQMTLTTAKGIAGSSTEEILKFQRNNYRRRRKTT